MKYNIELKTNKDCIVHFGDLKVHCEVRIIKMYKYITVQFYANFLLCTAQNSIIEPDRRMESISSASL